MSDECKEIEKEAKGFSRNNPKEAIKMYRQASNCWSKNDNIKNKNSNLEKAAKLLRETAKIIENSTDALIYSEDSSELYNEIGKVSDAKKVMQEAYQKFITEAKSIRSNANKMEDLYKAEAQFKIASEYFILGKNEQLSSACWIDSGDQFFKHATKIENPSLAHTVFNHAAVNYKHGNSDEKYNSSMLASADKFHKRANENVKLKRDYVSAIYNYTQANTIYLHFEDKRKGLDTQNQIQNIYDIVGISKEYLINWFETNEMHPISFTGLKVAINDVKEKESKILDTGIDLSNNTEIKQPLQRKEAILKEIPKIQPKESFPISSNEEADTISETMEEIDKTIDNVKPQEPPEDLTIEYKKAITPELKHEQIEPPSEMIQETNEELNFKLIEETKQQVSYEEPKQKEIRFEPEKVDRPPETIKEIKKVLDLEQPVDTASNAVDELVSAVENFEISVDAANDKLETIAKEEEIPFGKVEEPISTDYNSVIEPLVEESLITELDSTMEDPDPVLDVEIETMQDSEVKNNEIQQSIKEEQFDNSILIDTLRDHGYIQKEIFNENELSANNEYQLLLFMIKNHPSPLEVIEEKLDISSVSLALSNLQADGLLEQTNDYQWTVPKKVLDKMKGSKEEVMPELNKKSISEKQFIKVMHELGIISNMDLSLQVLMRIPEFKIIWTMKNKGSMKIEDIKKVVDDLPSLQVTSKISRLETDGLMTKNDSDLWQLSDKLALALTID